ncbi:ferredoxin [Prauserella sp. PE36]|uniref:Ferredoxin n=1 Tax=Prauserella endophytica TaxID=1592324 RepID=A0ABY2S499_9PSEU|nr:MULTISPECIES: ferredoxin [Prauserella]PXY25196.1 ferredoxin [Prauserella coralliicola]RBM23431.1 ferredoxin [Prauserella sp. PE36]TKG69239.1 ferredoxin [Prauserella endophytica]
MALVKADLDLCQGYANCVVAADDVFDLDDDGLVVVLRKEVSGSEMDRISDAARSCPVAALRVETP